METNIAVKALTALAQGTRLSIFRILVQAGKEGLSAGQIAKTLDIPNATLSFHLKELTNAGLITARQESRFIYYAANFTVMNELLGFLTENCCAGHSCGELVMVSCHEESTSGHEAETDYSSGSKMPCR
ncbi:ArsR/SmtB family transcription factor [Methylobacter tundripaludum]|uniref:ArsR/SmtB family transcription factor n=1 Tax=Methylobacter tundripaludum TaxID=173365 RepID=UPI00068E124E|nr:metalloregulator ArsR/SmtB family transcription factor [Methylobacter tundripaludum]